MLYALLCLLYLLSPALVRGSSYDDWPGDPEVREVDEEGAFKDNLSGLYYKAGANSSGSEDIVYAVQNKPSVLYQLQYDPVSALWEKTLEEGQSLHYPDGHGDPDAEVS